jgi:hypothetical protein
VRTTTDGLANSFPIWDRSLGLSRQIAGRQLVCTNRWQYWGPGRVPEMPQRLGFKSPDEAQTALAD